jgi:hypothetical protein
MASCKPASVLLERIRAVKVNQIKALQPSKRKVRGATADV